MREDDGVDVDVDGVHVVGSEFIQASRRKASRRMVGPLARVTDSHDPADARGGDFGRRRRASHASNRLIRQRGAPSEAARRLLRLIFLGGVPAIHMSNRCCAASSLSVGEPSCTRPSGRPPSAVIAIAARKRGGAGGV